MKVSKVLEGCTGAYDETENTFCLRSTVGVAGNRPHGTPSSLLKSTQNLVEYVNEFQWKVLAKGNFPCTDLYLCLQKNCDYGCGCDFLSQILGLWVHGECDDER